MSELKSWKVTWLAKKKEKHNTGTSERILNWIKEEIAKN